MNFDQVLNDPDCIAIMSSIVKRYKGLIDRAEAKSFKLEAAWEASEKYDPNHTSKMKFTTFLGNCLKFKILLFLRNKKAKQTGPIKDRESKDYTFLTDIMDCLDKEEQSLFVKKYLENYSSKELSDFYGLSRQSIKNKLNKIKNKIADYYNIDA